MDRALIGQDGSSGADRQLSPDIGQMEVWGRAHRAGQIRRLRMVCSRQVGHRSPGAGLRIDRRGGHLGVARGDHAYSGLGIAGATAPNGPGNRSHSRRGRSTGYRHRSWPDGYSRSRSRGRIRAPPPAAAAAHVIEVAVGGAVAVAVPIAVAEEAGVASVAEGTPSGGGRRRRRSRAAAAAAFTMEFIALSLGVVDRVGIGSSPFGSGEGRLAALKISI